jgi:20S proteasome subunit beta 4
LLLLAAVTGEDFVLMAADASAGFSIIIMKDSEDKIVEMDNNKLLAGNGEAGDRVQFTDFIQKNLSLHRFRNNRPLGTWAAANYLRNELATALRKGPYQTNMLLGGYDEQDGASLYFIDYLAR